MRYTGRKRRKKQDRLLQMLPVVFRELSGTLSSSRVLVNFLEQPLSFLWRVRNKKQGSWSELRPEIVDLGRFLMKKS